MYIYLASSWRNERIDDVHNALVGAGHSVYDFRYSRQAFAWDDLDPQWRSWVLEDLDEALQDERSIRASTDDKRALRECDACVLILESGKSSHWELGYMTALRDTISPSIKTFVLFEETGPIEADLIYIHADGFARTIPKLLEHVGQGPRQDQAPLKK